MAKQTSIQNQKGSRTFYIVALISTAIAVGIHFYLTLHHLALKYGTDEGASICNISSTFSCTAASLSKFSEFLGVPMALWGALTNAALLVWALLYPLSDENQKPMWRSGVLTLAGFIAATSVVMGLISVTQLTQYCPFCIATYVLSFISAFCFWKAMPKPLAATAVSQGAGGVPIKNLGITAIGIVLLTFILFAGIQKNYAGDTSGFDAQINAYIQEWQSGPQLTINPVDPVIKGNQDPAAKFTLVEFADFRCMHCKHAAPTLDSFIKAHPDVRLVFQTYPLDGECNADIPSANGASCLLARAFLCAAHVNKGWQANEWLFENQDKMETVDAVKSEIMSMAKQFGIDEGQFKTCTESDETRKAIEAQAKLGHTLGVKGTPSIYANNRLLPAGQVLPVLQKAYDTALSQ